MSGLQEKREATEERVTEGTREDRQEWHIDKSISVGHMVSTMTLAAALLGFVFSMNTKVETVSIRIDAIEERVTRNDARQAQDMAVIQSGQRRLEDKMDRIIERNAERGQ